MDETNLSFKTIKLRLFSPEVKFLKQTGKNLSISVVQKQQKNIGLLYHEVRGVSPDLIHSSKK